MFALATALRKKDEEVQVEVATFLHVAWLSAQKVCETLQWDAADDGKKIQPVIAHLRSS